MVANLSKKDIIQFNYAHLTHLKSSNFFHLNIKYHCLVLFFGSYKCAVSAVHSGFMEAIKQQFTILFIIFISTDSVTAVKAITFIRWKFIDANIDHSRNELWSKMCILYWKWELFFINSNQSVPEKKILLLMGQKDCG